MAQDTRANSPRPYAAAARAYHGRGWPGVLPLPAGQKKDPPAGFTGRSGRDPSGADLERWITTQSGGNIALRAPANVVGIDVDAYGDKRGRETLAAAEKLWGPLPATWTSTSREDGVSGIRWFRIPIGTALPGVLSVNGIADVEIIQRHHRYAVAPPSMHPSGQPYRWRKPDGEWQPGEEPPPAPEDFPDLPATWLEGLRRLGPKPDVAAFLASLPPGDPCAQMRKARQRALDACTGGSRHDGVRNAVSLIVRLGAEGHPGAASVLTEVVEAFVAHVAGTRPGGDGEDQLRAEFGRMAEGGVKWCLQKPPVEALKGCHCRSGITSADHPAEVDSSWPDPPVEEAFYGLAGDVVRAIEPTTEADPAAILAHFLIYFGSLAGLRPHFYVEETRHGLNEFMGVVGATSKARKGTADKRVRSLFRQVNEQWTKRRVKSGLSSGEGLIWQVRDPVSKFNAKTGAMEETDPGEPDKRLLVVEGELATVLRRIQGEGNSLSPLLRDAWDRMPLDTLVSERSKAKARADQNHVSVLGHITRQELRARMTQTEMANGFGNRFIWVCVKRSRLLPRGARPPELAALIVRVQDALIFAGNLTEPLDFDATAGLVWEHVYGALSESKPGLLGAIIARGEAHVIRLAEMYAVLDQSTVIRADHLLAALAVWDYAEASARHVFGDAVGDEDQDEVLAALRGSARGLTATDLRDHFQRNWPSGRIRAALTGLIEIGLAGAQREETGGRPATRYTAREARIIDAGGYLPLARAFLRDYAVNAVNAESADSSSEKTSSGVETLRGKSRPSEGIGEAEEKGQDFPRTFRVLSASPDSGPSEYESDDFPRLQRLPRTSETIEGQSAGGEQGAEPSRDVAKDGNTKGRDRGSL